MWLEMSRYPSNDQSQSLSSAQSKTLYFFSKTNRMYTSHGLRLIIMLITVQSDASYLRLLHDSILIYSVLWLKKRKEKEKFSACFLLFTWHTFGSNLLLLCCICLCRSCTCVLCLELRGRLGLDHKAMNIWTIKLLTLLMLETTVTVECPNRYSHCCLYLGDKS